MLDCLFAFSPSGDIKIITCIFCLLDPGWTCDWDFTVLHLCSYRHCLLNFAGELKWALPVSLRRVVGEWLLTDNAAYHTAVVCKASGKSLRPNKVKASMCKQSLSLPLKDNVWFIANFKSLFGPVFTVQFSLVPCLFLSVIFKNSI